MKIINLIWWLNILCNLQLLFEEHFIKNSMSSLDTWCLTYNNIILLIYFIYHLFKIQEINTQIEFVLYLFTNTIVACSLISYYYTLPRTRCSEIFFLYLIFCVAKFCARKQFPNFTKLKKW